MKFYKEDIIEAIEARGISKESAPCFAGVCTDTRTLKTGDLFVAIRGPHFNGHDFVEDALKGGASGAVVDESYAGEKNERVFVVKNTVKALGDLALWWRSKFSCPCIAITGSNGKTTTKEMTYAAIGGLGNILKTEGNFNNLIGMPLTIFRWNDSHDAAVIEMGMNATGEIARLTEIAKPSVGLITNVTAAHLEKLHTVETVASAKGELFDGMSEDSTAIINLEDKRIVKIAEKFKGRKVTFGMQNDADIRFMNMETEDLESMKVVVSIVGHEYELNLGVPGTHNVMNALAALSIAYVLDVDSKDACERISNFTPMSMRFERVQLFNGARLVNDSYNANPESMRAAFRTVGSAKRAGRFIAAIGDMLELGDSSKKLHEELGGDASRNGVDILLSTGDFSDDVCRGFSKQGTENKAISFASTEDISAFLIKELHAGDVLLIKGSRGMRMERIAETLKHEIGTG